MPSRHGTVKIDKALTEISLKYSNGAMVADAICPRVPVKMESDKYFVYDRVDFRTREALRADGADPNYVNALKASEAQYSCEEYSLADWVTDRELKNTDNPLSPATDKTENLTNMLMLGRERRVATLYTTAANWATDHYVTLSGTEQFNNTNFNSDSPVDGIEARIDVAKEKIRSAIGQDPNIIIIPSAVSRVVKKDSAIRNLIKYTQSDLLVNGDLPPTMFNMKVYIPGAVYDSAQEGQTYSGADMWGKDIVLAYQLPNPRGVKIMTASATFQAEPRVVSTWRVDSRKRQDYEVGEILVEKILSTFCGYVIKAAIA